MTIYEQHGYNNRLDYLTSLAEDAGENAELVFAAAKLLGPSEDFDGLISTLEDFGILRGKSFALSPPPEWGLFATLLLGLGFWGALAYLILNW